MENPIAQMLVHGTLDTLSVKATKQLAICLQKFDLDVAAQTGKMPDAKDSIFAAFMLVDRLAKQVTKEDYIWALNELRSPEPK